jgi:predicted RNase H-like HicB family nuclease
MRLKFEIELEDDGRWLAEVQEIAGAMAYGATQMEAMENVKALAYRVLAEQLQFNEVRPII